MSQPPLNKTTTPHPEMNGWILDNPPTVTPFHFEQININYWNKFVTNYSHYSIYIAISYILTIFTLKTWMKHKTPFNLTIPLFLWNLSLGIFSIVGFTRVSPPLYHVVVNDGFYTSMCVKKGLNLPNVLWGLLFAFSKIVELGDTVFMILRKRRVVFIQWYHHVTTLVVTWAVAPLMEPIGRYYGSLNYGVHGIMYPYFALKVIGVDVPWFVRRFITLLQFAQMVVGLGVNMASGYYKYMGYDCARDKSSIVAFTLVYGSFTIAFANLIFKRRDVVTDEQKRK